MLRKLTILSLLAGLAIAPQAPAFSIWGPIETWQTATLDYSNPVGSTRFWTGTIEEGGTKNFGEGSRLNCPIVTYAYDYTFLTYFGQDGVNAVDSAMALLNRLPKVSQASPRLTEFLTEGNLQINYTAQALAMLDLKSVTLHLMMEHSGLLGETHVFDMRARALLAAPCTYEYFVINRNWDPITFNPSTYVNGSQYNFTIIDGCPAGTQIADAIEAYADTAELPYTASAVATQEATFSHLGGYYLGLTRDDFGGLRYLYRKNNFNNEAMPSNTYVGTTFSSPWNIIPINTNAATGVGGGGGGVAGANGSGFVGLVGGIEKITYVKVAYDSVLGTTFGTNVIHYTLPVATNFSLSQVGVTRSNTSPDIIFTAADLAVDPADPSLTRSVNFIASGLAASPGAGVAPEVIDPSMVVTFNKVGPIYVNENPFFLDQSTALSYPTFQWGSYDGSDKPPITFPKGTSLTELESFVTSGQGIANSPFNPIVNTNTAATGGAGTGTAGAIILQQSP